MARAGSFLSLKTPDEAHAILARFPAIARAERIAIGDADGRVLAAPLASPEEHPAFARSAMDGWAVRAQDTFGAGDGAPAYLAFAGAIAMGASPPRALAAGEAMEISTGACLPDGADAVVMIEHSERAGETVEIVRAAGVGENVILAGDDVKAGAEILPARRRLRPADLALAAAVGVREVTVLARPIVAILSTGDELVPREAAPGAAQVRDVNSLALEAQVRRAGGVARLHGIVRDEPAALRTAVAAALDGADALLLSGGSSAGVRDHTAETLDALGEPGVLAHGIAIAPGKPTILAARGDVPLVGMPGYPVSSLVIFEVFVAPLVHRLGGVADPPPPFGRVVRATLAKQIASKPGREDWARVTLERNGASWRANPVRGGTGALSSLALADGFVRVAMNEEGIPAGLDVDVLCWEG